jgi:hypothetical protein
MSIQSNIALVEKSIVSGQDTIRLFEKYLQNTNLTPLQRSRAERNLVRAQEDLVALQVELAYLQEQLNAAPSSAGDTTAQAQVARDDQANTTATAPQQQVETPDGRITNKPSIAPTNADVPATTANGNADAGTNAETRTLNNTQSIPSPEPFGALPDPPSFLDPPPQDASPGFAPVNNATQGGVGARGDDAAQPTTNAVRNRLDELYGGASNVIISQDNILDQFASYTYSLSWYLVDPATYNQLIKSPKQNLDGYYLLAQSGGAPINNQVPTQTVDPQQAAQTQRTVGYGRSPFFPLDYYIDNFEFGINYAGSLASGGPSTFTDVSFTISEPNGITLLDNLFLAVSDLYQKKNIVNPGTVPNYISAVFVMVVRFYGYDINGNLVQPIARRTGTTDRQAAIEKFIPFVIKDINFRVANKLVEYNVTGTGVDTNTAFSTDRGSIPQNFQFQGTTVKDILVGTVVQQTASQAAGDQVRNGIPIQTSPPGSNNIQQPQQQYQAILDGVGTGLWEKG